MKKLSTFIFAAFLGIGSCWGTDYIIGMDGTIGSSVYAPICLEANAYNSISQQIYLASELTAKGAVAGDISAISFYYNNTTEYSRGTIEVWIAQASNAYFGSSESSSCWMYSKSSTDTKAGTNVFSGAVTIPNSAGWYKITFANSFAWDGKSNLIITINDKSNTKINQAKYHKTYTTAKTMCVYKYGGSGTQNNAENTYNIQGQSKLFAPVIKFSFGSEPEPEEPELTATCASPDFGTFAKEYETRSTTITVTGKNLTEDVTISAADGMTVDPASLTKEAVMATGGATITVTTNSSFVSGKKVTISGDKIEKTVTLTGTEATFIERNGYTFLYNSDLNSYSLLVGPTEIASVDASAQTFVIGSGSQACTIDYSAVPSTYVAHGKVSNLKVKKTGTGLFKAFAFDYAATGKTISETNENNQITHGTVTNVTLNRTLVADDYYSTIYLPFAVTAEQIADQFGEGTVVQELTEASLSDNNNELTLNFSTVTAMVAGQPYLINPKQGGSSFIFNNVTLDNTDRSYKSTNLDFIGTFDQINLTVGNKNTLLLGAENGLGWAQSSGTFKGLRAYFLVKYNSGASAPERLSTRMIFDNTTKIQELQNNSTPTSDVHKFVNNGQLIIIRNGVKYNAQGARL